MNTFNLSKRILLTLAGMAIYLPSQAMFQYKCDVWSNKEKLNLEISGVLAASLGDKGVDREVNPSTMTVIQKKYENNKEEQTLLFNDELSHLNVARPNGDWGADGMFKQVDTTMYPIQPDGSVGKQIVKVRNLSFHVYMQPGNGFDYVKIEAQQDSPTSGTFISNNSEFSLNGKVYKDLSTNCGLAVYWNYYLQKK